MPKIWLVTGLAMFAVMGADTALIEAARHGGAQAVRAEIAKKADVNATEGDGSTALLWASYGDDLASADLLIRAGAKVNAANDLGATPLWAACMNGSAAMVRKLLDAGADSNAALLLGETPLMIAARTGKAEIAKMLLGKGANPNARAARGQTALMWAVGQRHPEVVKMLLASGADVHARSDTWSQVMAVPPHGYPAYNKAIPHGNDSALLFAARVGDLESAKLLVAAGANVNDADAWGVSVTVLAAHSGYREFVEFLLVKGANPNAAEAGFTALHEAIMRRDEKMAEALLARGADPNAPLRTWTPTRRSSRDFHFDPALVGATPFWLAARFLQPDMMRLLAKHGAEAKAVHESEFVSDGPFVRRTVTTNAILAALGKGGGASWVEPEREQREALTLETVMTAVELGVKVDDSALQAAKALRYPGVVQFLNDRGQ